MNMVWVEINDDVWKSCLQAYALLGVKSPAQVTHLLEDQLVLIAMALMLQAEQEQISNEPEALMRRARGLMKDRIARKLVAEGYNSTVAHQYAGHFIRNEIIPELEPGPGVQASLLAFFNVTK